MLKFTLTALVLCSAAGSASAVTLSYSGLNYTTVSVAGPGLACEVGCVGPVFPNGHDASMNVTVELELSRSLNPGESFFFGENSALNGASSPELIAFAMSDGLYVRNIDGSRQTLFGEITADESGEIFVWDISLENYSPFDFDRVTSNSETGETALHQREYAAIDPETGEFVFAAVISDASVGTPGTWTYSDVGAVPLPASLPLAIVGLGFFGAASLRKRVAT